MASDLPGASGALKAPVDGSAMARSLFEAHKRRKRSAAEAESGAGPSESAAPQPEPDLERQLREKARQALLRESQRAAQRAEQVGSQGW